MAKDVAIATSTFYGDSPNDVIRSNVARRTIDEAARLGYDVHIVDGGSRQELLSQFEKSGAHVYSQSEKGMGKGRRQAFRKSHESGRDIVVWMEPEKQPYVSQIEKTIEGIDFGSDMVIPRRKSLKSYPVSQQYAEPLGNEVWKSLTGTDLDMWFGPRVMRREMTRYFLDYDGAHGDKWDSIFIPVMDVIIDGQTVTGVDVDYIHPPEQTKIESGSVALDLKRVEQLDTLTKALSAHWTARKK